MNNFIIMLIRKYQTHISKNTSPKCKYMPSCSHYGLECFQKFNFSKAFFLTIWRIIRCNPFSHGGYDPVPLNHIEKTLKQLTNFIH